MNDFAELSLFEASRVSSDDVAALNFATPIALDPELPSRLLRAQAEVALALPELEQAAIRGDSSAISGGARHLIEQVRAMHRLEALRLFPAISRQFNGDPEVSSAFAQMRLEATGVGRKVLRLLEDAERSGTIGASDVKLAQSLWQRYSHECRELYQLYPKPAPK
jgi:hypothetical protein